MPDLFRTFFEALPHHNGYCLACLGRMFHAAPEQISGHLAELGLAGGKRECDNCGQLKETFRRES